MVLIALLVACVPKPAAPVAGAEDPVPAHPDGPIAGPHAIVEEPLPPPPAPDTPGGGPMNPYVVQVRKVVGDALLKCVESGPMTIASDAALVTVTIAADGNLVNVVLNRSSGADAYDECLLRSF